MNDDVVIQDVGTNDTFACLSELYTTSLWTIELDDMGYVIKNVGLDGRTLYAENAFKERYPDTLLAQYETNISHCHWQLQRVETPRSGAILYKDGIATSNIRLAILKGQTIELSSAGIIPAAYSSETISQEFFWISSTPDIISVNSATGAVTAIDNQLTQNNIDYDTS